MKARDLNHKPRIFQDLDGCLGAFDQLATEIFGMPPGDFEAQYGSKRFWKTLRDYRNDAGEGFFAALPLMPDARELWDAIKHLDPIILTGCPLGDWAPPQKVAWAKKQFGDDVKIITCMAREKIKHIENPGDILVDDKTKFQSIWEQGGGVFVHHTDTASTLAKLEKLGVL